MWPSIAVQASEDIVFRSDVSLVRVDVRATDSYGRVLSGLTKQDFELRDEGRVRPIRNFAAEDMPVDLVLLIDISTSMRPHVEKVAAAMNDALGVLGDDDRVALIVFDRRVRIRDRFLSSRREIEAAMDRLLRDESFRGGTDITLGLYEAARFVDRGARKDARKAIVIVTDDYTERNRDVEGVSQALLDSDIVLEALLAPDAMNQGRRVPDWPGGGGSWPGRGPAIGRMPWPTSGGRLPGGVIIGNGGGLQRAGTDQIAEASGGQALPVLDSGSLPESFRQIRQRYALYFTPSEDARPGERRSLQVTLVNRRYAAAQLQYRPVYLAAGPSDRSTARDSSPAETAVRRPQVGASAEPATVEDPAPAASRQTTEPERELTGPNLNGRGEATAPRRGGWRRVKPGEKPFD